VIPNGFKLDWRPAFVPTDEETRTINNIMEDTSLNVIGETLQHNVTHLAALQRKEEDIWDIIKMDASRKQQIEICKAVKQDRKKASDKIELVKRCKLSKLNNNEILAHDDKSN
jgi:hypothetical protein